MPGADQGALLKLQSLQMGVEANLYIIDAIVGSLLKKNQSNKQWGLFAYKHQNVETSLR